MAVGIHVARVGFLKVNSLGNVISKDDPTISIAQHLDSSHDHRVLPDTSIPNTSGYPTVKTYLELEADNNYVLRHMDQTMIITYETTP